MTKGKGSQGAPDKDARPSSHGPIVPGAQGATAPHLARQFGHRDTRLVKAVRSLSAELLADLLETSGEIELGRKAIDVNAQDEEGMTALHHAAALGARPCIRLLVATGKCNYLLRDNKGRYAFELAAEWARDYAVARLLSKKQAQQAAAQGVPAYVPRA